MPRLRPGIRSGALSAEDLVSGHRSEDQEAQNGLLVGRVHAQQVQTVADESEGQDPEGASPDRTRTSEDADTAVNAYESGYALVAPVPYRPA